MKVVIDDKIPFIKGVLEPFMDVLYLNGSGISDKDLIDADALIIRTRTKCNKQLLNNTGIKFIASATIGFDHIDTEYCHNAGIYWTNAPGCNSSSVMQYIASALLYLSKYKNISLKNKTLGIVGVGHVGTKVAKMAELLGMNVLLNDPPRQRIEKKIKFVSLDEILSKSDIITLHVPLNYTGIDKTFHLFNNELFSLIPSHAWLINTARGEVIETEALKKALNEKRLAGCILDVWENEPAIDKQLLALASIATQHIAGYSMDGKANGTAMSIQALSRFFKLGIDDWYPPFIEEPSNPVIHLDNDEKSFYDIIYKVISSTYKILNDDARLRNDPAGFERQRSEYPPRREFKTYSIEGKNIPGDIKNLLTDLGFNQL